MTRAARRRLPLAAALLVFVLGALAWAGVGAGLRAAESDAFCTGCHSMKTPAAEIRTSLHRSNASGVAAHCADCHVPPDAAGRVLRHLQGVREAWHEWQGTVSTPERFEAHRLEMASREWRRMETSGSAECRRCHAWDAMAPDVQKKSAYAKHQRAQADGKSCIACHKGVAHELPRDWVDPEDEAAARPEQSATAG